nr:hypothetical protein [Lentilactobacillus otakiensis]
MDWIGPAISRHPDVIKDYGDSRVVNRLADDPSHFKLVFYDNAKVIEGQKRLELQRPIQMLDGTASSGDPCLRCEHATGQAYDDL